MVEEIGKKVDNKESVYFWCYKNKVPVFCPAITDGAIGDSLFFQSYKWDDFQVDISSDAKSIFQLAHDASKTAALILGAGMVKHHIMEANSVRGGLDYCVLINNGLIYDGSDSGADRETELSNKRIKEDCRYVKIFTEVTLVFPLMVAQTFAKEVEKKDN